MHTPHPKHHPLKRAALTALRFTLRGTGSLLTGTGALLRGTGTALQFCGHRLAAFAADIGAHAAQPSAPPEAHPAEGAHGETSAAV